MPITQQPKVTLSGLPPATTPATGATASELGVVRRPTVRVIAASPQSPTGAQRRVWVYIKHALMQPWHVAVLAGATVFGVANWSIVVMLLVFTGAEALLLGIVLQVRAFRRYVDERLDQIERARAAELRAGLLLQMGDEHRRELMRLEVIIDRMRDATRPQGTAAQIAVDECQSLLAAYVRLAIVFNAGHECLASVDRSALDENARTLEAARFSQHRQTRALAQRRLLITRKRAERWDRSREALESIAHQLALIGELIQLTHERVAAPADPIEATGEIDRMVQELEDYQSIIEELAEFFAVDETVEPRVLEMGRVARV